MDVGDKLLLDLQAPYDVPTDDWAACSREFSECMDACRWQLNGGEKSLTSFGDFAIIGAYPAPELQMATNDIVAATNQYIMAMSNGENAVPAADVIVMGASRQITFESWMVFSTTVPLCNGRIDIRLSYPDRRWIDDDKKPIDAIDSFLSAALTWYGGTHDQTYRDMAAGLQRWKTNAPAGTQAPEALRSMVFIGEGYWPVGGSYAFDDSRIAFVADGHQLPHHHQALPVVREFRNQLAQQVEELSE